MKRIYSALALLSVLLVMLMSGCNTDVPSSSDASTTTANSSTTTTTAKEEQPLPEVQGIVEGEMTTAQKDAYAQGSHTYVSGVALTDESAGKEATVVGADGSFFDDFADGIDPTVWNLVDQAWGGKNNGVKPENVSYTDDGVVVLSAYGDYAADAAYKRSGACLRTIAPLGPGSFEVRMKVLPRLGTCTAMWTYFNDGTRNHEIDIEVPGNQRSFRYSLFTNWLTESNNSSQHTIPQFSHNDGEWHTYRFEWHTDPEQIDYYIDDVFQVSSTTQVPSVATYFWVGVWFPQEWCGDPAFDTAHMLVDWVKYTPYDEPSETTIYGAGETAEELYPSEPVMLPVNNYAAGGSFEYDSEAWKTVGNAARVLTPNGENRILRIDDEQSSVYQRISSINGESEYMLTLSAAVSEVGSTAKAVVEYVSATGNGMIGTEVTELTFDKTDMTPRSVVFTTPKGTYYLRVRLMGSGDGEFYFDDLYVTQPNRGDFAIEE